MLVLLPNTVTLRYARLPRPVDPRSLRPNPSRSDAPTPPSPAILAFYSALLQAMSLLYYLSVMLSRNASLLAI